MMNVSGPCFVIIKNGEPFNKYEVVATESTPLCVTTEAFYFDKKEDAELYIKYLLQEAGLKDINKFLASTRTFKWEKDEYKEFKNSINWEELRTAVKNIKFEYNKTVFRRNKK